MRDRVVHAGVLALLIAAGLTALLLQLLHLTASTELSLLFAILLIPGWLFAGGGISPRLGWVLANNTFVYSAVA